MAFKNVSVVALATAAFLGSVSAVPQGFGGNQDFGGNQGFGDDLNFNIPTFSFSMPNFDNMFDGVHEALGSILGDPNVMKSASQALNSANQFISNNPGFLSSINDNPIVPTDNGNDNNNNEDILGGKSSSSKKSSKIDQDDENDNGNDNGEDEEDAETTTKKKNPFTTSGASGIKPLAGVVAVAGLTVAAALF
ncbi:hypothetical protein FB645_001881 [Coemansia sp. IMI 203386]|nr:hypothetical protein FB645_001881 [Coemansia sp. IMI 203386]